MSHHLLRLRAAIAKWTPSLSPELKIQSEAYLSTRVPSDATDEQIAQAACDSAVRLEELHCFEGSSAAFDEERVKAELARSTAPAPQARSRGYNPMSRQKPNGAWK